MSSKDLEVVVLAFFNGEVDVLVCTTIIESGLDVTNANSIIIRDAQNLGWHSFTKSGESWSWL